MRSGLSVSMVCAYCGNTVVRKDRKLEDMGKISALVEDASPICLGAGGRFDGEAFDVVGRLQLEYGSGYWNEWYLLFDDGRTGWLGEAAGQYFITFELPPGKVGKLPPLGDISPGAKAGLGGTNFWVSDVRNARCTGGEGELPFLAGDGYELPFADLRRPDRQFATIDYSEDPPKVFVGRSVDWPSLAMEGHRTFDGWDE